MENLIYLLQLNLVGYEMGKIGLALRVLGLTMLLTLTLITTGILKVNAQATQELAYDDGEADAGIASATGWQRAVKFSLPDGWSKAILLEAKYYFCMCDGSKVPIGVHVYDGARNKIASLQIYPPTMSMAWYDVDLSSLNIVVDGDFYISIEYNSGNPFLGLDKDPPIDQRSYAIDEYGTWYGPDSAYDYMIRVVIGQPKPPVGGIIIPPEENPAAAVNNTAIIVALAIALISTLTIATKRKLDK